MIRINCDIGERGPHHPDDHKLMQYISMANIACGGHSGDRESVSVFRKISEERNIKISAHLSYPDRENFGRNTIDIKLPDLLESLTRQYSLLDGVKTVKLHGALYNDCNTDTHLAGEMAQWMKKNGIEEVVTPFDSALAEACAGAGIAVLAEAFAERRYNYDAVTGRLTLVSRKESFASITDIEEAMEHSINIINNGKIKAFRKTGNGTEVVEVPIKADTICIHSDSEISLALAERLSSVILPEGKNV